MLNSPQTIDHYYHNYFRLINSLHIINEFPIFNPINIKIYT
jgi:hypothetical protein